MKKLLCVALVALSALTYAQKTVTDTVLVNEVSPCYLHFVDEVTEALPGNKILVRATIDGNKVRVSAGDVGFKEVTNLLVQTKTAEYLFVIKYGENLSSFKHYELADAVHVDADAVVKEENAEVVEATGSEAMTVEELAKVKTKATEVMDMTKRVYDWGIKDNKTKMDVLVTGMFISEDRIYLKMNITNRSSVNFDMDLLSISKEDRKGVIKKNAINDNQTMVPLFTTGEEDKRVVAGGTVTKVFVFEKFTIVDKKFLYVELWEDLSGDRMVNFRIPGKKLLDLERI